MGFFDNCEGCCSPRAYVWRNYASYFDVYNFALASRLMLGYGPYSVNPFDRPPLLGTGSTTIPKQGDWIFLSVCDVRSYGILADGSLWGWGKAPLGDGTLNDHDHPHRIGSGRWKYVSTCATHTLAIKEDGSLWSWGENDSGQLGNGNYYQTYRVSPRVLINSAIESVSIDESVFSQVRDTPTSVSFLKPSSADPGSGAQASCSVSLFVAGINAVSSSSLGYSSGTTHYSLIGGSGYQSVPRVVITPEVASPCIMTANCSFYISGAATIVSGGSGYGSDTRVIFTPNSDGDAASATCVVADGVITQIVPEDGFYYTSPPQVTILGTGTGAVVSPVVSNGTVVSVTISSPGSGYTSPPTISFQGGSPQTPASAFAVMQADSISVNVTSGGSGYTHSEGNKIKTLLNFSSGPSVAIGTVNLAPSGLSSVTSNWAPTISLNSGQIQFEPFYTTASWPEIPTHAFTQQSLKDAFSNLSVKADLVSSDAADVALNVEYEPYFDYTGQYLFPRWKVSLPSPIYGRTAQFAVRVLVPSVDVDITPPIAESVTSQHRHGSTETSLVIERGEADFVSSTGAWQKVDQFDNYTIFRCIASESESFDPWTETQRDVYLDGTVIVDEVRGGPPPYPPYEYIPWGWTRSLNLYSIQDNYQSSGTPRTPPEWAVNKAHAKEKSYIVNQGFVAPVNFSPGVTTIIEGDGAGGQVNSYFPSSGGTLQFSIASSGQGYTYEPSVDVTTLTLSPARVGGDSDWVSVVAVGQSVSGCRGSAGLRSDGWPMRWGFRDAFGYRDLYSGTPAKVGFPLLATITEGDTLINWSSFDWANEFDRVNENIGIFLPSSSQSVIGRSPQTTGLVMPFPATKVTTPQGVVLSWISSTDEIIRLAGSLFWRRNGVSLPNWTRLVGRPQSIYTFKNVATNSDFPTPQNYSFYSYSSGLENTYRHFVPFPYTREAVSPKLVSSTYAGRYTLCLGSSFVSTPNLGPEVSCDLHAPGRCKRLFVDDGRLMAISEQGELWSLQDVDGSSVKHSTMHVVEDKDAKVTLKGYKYEADVIWNWDTATREQTVTGITSNFGYGDFLRIARSDTFTTRYLLPPIKSVENETSEWSNSIQVSPHTIWKVVITDPGSGYSPSDHLSIRVYGGQTVDFVRNYSQTSSVELTTESQEFLKYTYEGMIVGDTLLAGTKTYHVTYVGNGSDASNRTGNSLPVEKLIIGKPPRRIMAVLGTGLDSATLEVDTVNVDLNRIKKLTFHVKDSYEPQIIDHPEEYVSSNQLVISCGGVYVSVTPGYFGNAPSEAFVIAPKGMFVTVPSVEIISNTGSGSGAKAVLVPVRLPTGYDLISNRFYGPQASIVPFKVSHDVNEYGQTVKDANSQYCVTDSGLYQLQNPAVPAPQPHQKGITSLCNHLARTTSRDLYKLRSTSVLEAPRAFMNVELLIQDPGENYRLPPLISMPQPDTKVAVAEAHLDGKLVSLGVESAGSGYRYAPVLTLSGGGGSGATARAVISGPVDSVTVTGGGDGYAAVPRVKFSSPGIPASASASVSGFVSSIVLADGGSGYSKTPPEVIISGDGAGASAAATTSGRVSMVIVSSGGGGYDTPPTVVISGGGGTGARAVAHMVQNTATGKYSVQYFEVISGGSGYTSDPTVTVSPPPSGNTGASPAKAYASIDFFVSTISVASGGSGYSRPPIVTIVGGNARAFAFLSMSVNGVTLSSGGRYRSAPSVSFDPVGTVESISLTSGGTKYSRAPEVLIVGGGGSGAHAVCTIDSSGSVDRVTLASRGSGYNPNSSPSVVFIGGGGSGAAATASVGLLGSGASASTTINGSILFAEPTADGSGYQFAPSVQISGGGNQAADLLDSQLASGQISQSQYNKEIAEVRGVVQARIEGKVDRINITNAGDRYSSNINAYDSKSLANIHSRAVLHGFYGKNGHPSESIVFQATSGHPGGSVSQPASMPTSLFVQKPQIRFLNGVYAQAQDFLSAWETCCGLRTYPSRPATGNRYQVVAVFDEELSFSSSPANYYWKDREGFPEFSFVNAPVIELIDDRGSGAKVSVSLDDGGKLSQVSLSSQGSGYSTRTSYQVRNGWFRAEGCIATCTINSSGAVTSVSVTSSGTGYIIPAAVVHGGGGSGAVLSVELVSGKNPRGVKTISVLSGGSGYSQSNPPQILVYDMSGSFEESEYGKRLNSYLLSLASSSFNSLMSGGSISAEYVPPLEPQMASAYDLQALAIPDVDGSLVIDKFYRLSQIENLAVASYGQTPYATEDLQTSPYQSAPTVTVEGTCDRQASVVAQAAKWTSVVDAYKSGQYEYEAAVRDTGL